MSLRVTLCFIACVALVQAFHDKSFHSNKKHKFSGLFDDEKYSGDSLGFEIPIKEQINVQSVSPVPIHDPSDAIKSFVSSVHETKDKGKLFIVELLKKKIDSLLAVPMVIQGILGDKINTTRTKFNLTLSPISEPDTDFNAGDELDLDINGETNLIPSEEDTDDLLAQIENEREESSIEESEDTSDDNLIKEDLTTEDEKESTDLYEDIEDPSDIDLTLDNDRRGKTLSFSKFHSVSAQSTNHSPMVSMELDQIYQNATNFVDLLINEAVWQSADEETKMQRLAALRNIGKKIRHKIDICDESSEGMSHSGKIDVVKKMFDSTFDAVKSMKISIDDGLLRMIKKKEDLVKKHRNSI